MKSLKLCCTLTILLYTLPLVLSKSPLKEILKVVAEPFNLAWKAGNLVFRILKDCGIFNEMNGTNENRRKVMNLMGQLSSGIKKIDYKVQINSKILKQIAEEYSGTSTKLKLNELDDLVTRISVLYNRMQMFINMNETMKFNNLTLENFANWTVSHNTYSAINIVERIHALLDPHDKDIETGLMNKGLIHMMKEMLQSSPSYICTLQKSPKGLLLNMFEIILMTEIKGYIMTQFAYSLQKLQTNENYTKEIELAKDRYMFRIKTLENITSHVILTADSTFRTCDPPKQIEGETFVRLTKYNTLIEVSESFFNKVWSPCMGGCDDKQYMSDYACKKLPDLSRGNLFAWITSFGFPRIAMKFIGTPNYSSHNVTRCRREQCIGKVANCRKYSDNTAVCPVVEGERKKRRYEWVRSAKELSGEDLKCKEKIVHDDRFLYTFFYCEPCICTCEYDLTSERFISMQEVTSDINNNMVITGLRFVKINAIIYVQINEGKLMPGGKIDPNSTRWKPIEEINDGNMENECFHFSNTHPGINLDIIDTSPSNLITGIKFTESDNGFLTMQIFANPLNTTTGILSSSRVFYNNTSILNREKLDIAMDQVPTLCETNDIDSEYGQYVEFTHTNFETDSEQTTVPFFDAQPVMPKTPSPLIKVGLYHKGQRGYGGYVGIIVETFEFSEYLNSSLLLK